jgi:predicted 2-oxoglutarate/Fe(II)-dependent dioxygenase YbiX
MFFQSAARADSGLILNELLQQRRKFDDDFVTFFGVSTDPLDQQLGRVQEQVPGMRFYWDFDQSVSRLFGALQADPTSGVESYVCHTVLLDTRLRTLVVIPFDDPATYVTRLLRMIDSIPPLAQPSIATSQAPVLIVPRIFEPDFCRHLINQYEEHGGIESGFMREEGGKTVGAYDHGHKRRQDYEIQDDQLRRACMARIHARLVPEIEKAFQFKATRMERYIVSCYDGSQGAHFRAHRDNTTKGTAHRKFAVSLVLNTGEFDGGFIWFPEFGRQLFAPPAGGAVIFSCSLLHEATPVTRGKRFVFLPFLYDDAAAQLREENQRFLAGDVNTPKQAGPA